MIEDRSPQLPTNVTVLHNKRNAAGEPQETDIQSALQHILASQFFAKSRRLSSLLSYLMDKRVNGAARDLMEYGIGIDFFNRDPGVYNTSEDPIVRVQIGRLRDKLRQYYAEYGHITLLRITIPIGSYVPQINWAPRHESGKRESRPVVFSPLECIAQGEKSRLFTQGLNEELGYRLFAALGKTLHSQNGRRSRSGSPLSTMDEWHDAFKLPQDGLLLSGGVRVEPAQLRVGIRIIDATDGRVVRSWQVERQCELSIALQEEVAVEITRAVRSLLTGL